VPTGSAELANELKTLRKGRGLQAPKLADQVGPMLRELCGVGRTDSAAVIREKLSARLRNLADRLPEDLRQAVTIALALQPDTQQQFLQDRVQFLADLHKRDVRTIRRRMDEGFELLAEIATRPNGAGRGGTGQAWYIERLESTLRMDKPARECFERRTIVAEWDGLDRIQGMTTLPKEQAYTGDRFDLNFELYYGAILTTSYKKTENRFAYELALPQPLSIGERHEYGLISRVPEDQPMRTHYVFFPERRCEEFHLRIRFDLAKAPATIWRVAEVFHRDVDDIRPTESLLAVDKVGEVSLSFQNLLPGHGYGVQWLPFS
jgi:hypothetical protein